MNVIQYQYSLKIVFVQLIIRYMLMVKNKLKVSGNIL